MRRPYHSDLIDERLAILGPMIPIHDDAMWASHAPARLTAERCTRPEAVLGDAKHRNHAVDAWLADGRGDEADVMEAVDRTFARIGRSRRDSRDHDQIKS